MGSQSFQGRQQLGPTGIRFARGKSDPRPAAEGKLHRDGLHQRRCPQYIFGKGTKHSFPRRDRKVMIHGTSSLFSAVPSKT
ncbi:Uncharacterised protein [uncultured Blautia sp.]|nr:Uncharacterised protein [uncultured Blautia sp.]